MYMGYGRQWGQGSLLGVTRKKPQIWAVAGRVYGFAWALVGSMRSLDPRRP